VMRGNDDRDSSADASGTDALISVYPQESFFCKSSIVIKHTFWLRENKI